MIFFFRKNVLDGVRFSFYSVGKLEYAEMAGQIIDLSYW